jgi:polyferredoxin
MECIGCTACIDACDEIMEKVKKPKGLIRYGSLASEVEGAPFRWRTLLYGAFVMIGFSGIAWSFTARDSFMVTLLRAKDTPYQVVGEEVINHYKLHLHNQTLMETAFEITLDELATQSGVRVTLPPGKSVVPGGGEKIQHFFVLFPKAFLEGKAEREVFVRVKDLNSQSVKERSLKLLGPL